MSLIHTTFSAGATGEWRVERITNVVGEALRFAPGLSLATPDLAPPAERCVWQLHGVTSNMRYTTRHEAERLAVVQQGLGRSAATCAALIPLRKNAAWWQMAQDERRAIIAAQSQHISIGMDYLPAVARRLYHARELGGPFDFLTWFEYAPEDADAFEHLLARLRQTAEWRYVEHEVDIRLARSSALP